MNQRSPALAVPHDDAESIAAFFDLDGTLLPRPSLEKRFFRALRDRRAIGLANYLYWLAEGARLLPRGIKQILYANKMYLRGVNVNEADGDRDERKARIRQKSGTRDAERVGADPHAFFPQALERLAWHSRRGHAVLIVSGTLQPLATHTAAVLEDQLAALGIPTTIGVYATRVEACDGKWTGRVVGEAMFGEAKARAIRKIAVSRRFALEKCFAYGDSASDRWMLESVGRPVAVNPSNDLARIATRNGWPTLRWNNSQNSTRNSLGIVQGQNGEEVAQGFCTVQSKLRSQL